MARPPVFLCCYKCVVWPLGDQPENQPASSNCQDLLVISYGSTFHKRATAWKRWHCRTVEFRVRSADSLMCSPHVGGSVAWQHKE